LSEELKGIARSLLAGTFLPHKTQTWTELYTTIILSFDLKLAFGLNFKNFYCFDSILYFNAANVNIQESLKLCQFMAFEVESLMNDTKIFDERRN